MNEHFPYDATIDRRFLLAASGAVAVTAITGVGEAATGLLAATNASARPFQFDPAALWLGRDLPAKPATFGTQAAAPLLRRAFEMPSGVKSAVLRIAAYGYYSAEINGKPVSAAVLDPPPSQFDRTIFSRSIDVTALLRSGKNAIGFMLGRSYVSGIAGPGAPWILEPRLLAQLDVTHADGRIEHLVTDGLWKMADSPIHDWMYFGEDYDARAEKPGWSSPEYDAREWHSGPVQKAPTASITPATVPAVVVTDTFLPSKTSTLAPGSTLYDFGKITAGWARIRVRGRAGTRLEISYGQQLNKDGTVYLALPWGTTDPKMRQHVDHYTLKGGGVETWEPRFTRHGFQFVQVQVQEGTLDDLAIEARECHTPVESTGAFTCSNPVINKLHENQRRSLLLNHWGFPTDTSWRDRQGWTADTALYLDSGILNFAGLKTLYTDWLHTLRDTQQADGSIAAFAPNTLGFPAFNDPSWGGMIVMIPWELYQHLGDKSILAENYPAMTRWMNLMDGKIAAKGNLYDGFSFGDHGPVGAEKSGTMDIGNIEGPDITRNAHLYHEARTLAQIARLMDRKADAIRYDAMADRILPAFNARYFDPKANTYQTPKHVGYRQTSNLLPLAFDMVPEGHREAVFANLVADVEARGRHLNTGSLGTKLILPVLTRFGRADLAYALLAQTSYPSWGFWITQGATTSWEVWSIGGLDQTLDHPFLGTFDEWLYQGLAGIQAAAPGYAKVRLSPLLPRELEHLSATITTPRGTVRSSWRRQGDRTVYEATLPAGGASELILPFPSASIKTLKGELKLVNEAAGRSTYLTNSRELAIQII